VQAEIDRLHRQEEEILGFLTKANRKLNNENFVSRAPAEVVERERTRAAELTEKLTRVRRQLETLEKTEA